MLNLANCAESVMNCLSLIHTFQPNSFGACLVCLVFLVFFVCVFGVFVVFVCGFFVFWSMVLWGWTVSLHLPPPPGWFDKEKKWTGIAQEVTWVLQAASEAATSVSTFPGNRRWLCSAHTGRGGYPRSLPDPRVAFSGSRWGKKFLSPKGCHSSPVTHMHASAAPLRQLCH